MHLERMILLSLMAGIVAGGLVWYGLGFAENLGTHLRQAMREHRTAKLQAMKDKRAAIEAEVRREQGR